MKNCDAVVYSDTLTPSEYRSVIDGARLSNRPLTYVSVAVVHAENSDSHVIVLGQKNIEGSNFRDLLILQSEIEEILSEVSGRIKELTH